MQQLQEQFRLLAAVTVVGVEQENPDAPTIFIDSARMAEKRSTTPRIKRSQLLQMLTKNLSPDAKS